MASPAYDRVTAKILELLDAGVVPWRKPSATTAPISLTTGHEYHGVNRLLLSCAPYGSPFWVTFKQARARGGHVRKGEAGWPVVFWKRWEKRTGEYDDGNEIVKRIPILRYFIAFNVEQVEGVEVPPIPGQEPREHTPIEAAERIIAGMPNRPNLTHGEARAHYRPSTDTVNLPRPEVFESSESYYATSFHEHVHATGHESRLNRKSVAEAAFGSHDYGEEELTAEVGAAFLAAEAGISPATIENSAAYIDGWRRAIKADAKLVVVAAGRATKAADYILGA